MTMAARKKWPIIAGASAAVVVIAAAATIPVLHRGEVPSAKSAAALAPAMSGDKQPEDAAPTPAHSTTVPTSSATATSVGQGRISSEATPRRGSQERAPIMEDQLHRPTRLKVKGNPAEQAPGGFAAAEIHGLDNSNAIGAAFSSSKQPRVQSASQQTISAKLPRDQTASQQVITVPPALALGLLIEKRQPVYPLIAKAARVSGIVVLVATISKTGTVESLQVVSGPAMLRDSALNAVRSWRFKPYFVNNQPTAIQTTINLHFSVD
jgi:protein TonB